MMLYIYKPATGPALLKPTTPNAAGAATGTTAAPTAPPAKPATRSLGPPSDLNADRQSLLNTLPTSSNQTSTEWN